MFKRRRVYRYWRRDGARHTSACQHREFRANGDLDCDGDFSTFEMFGTVDTLYADGPTGSASLRRVSELE